MQAFVAGATGETGRRIVRELVSRGIPVRALVRSRQLAAQVLPPEAE
ncbi:MAG: NAD(P)H-binding protein, partial [Thermostichus sp. DG_1_5_bins_95]